MSNTFTMKVNYGTAQLPWYEVQYDAPLPIGLDNQGNAVYSDPPGPRQKNIHTDIINDRFFGFENAQLESIKTGAWELPMYPHLTDAHSGDIIIDRTCYIRYDNDILCIEIRRAKDRSIYAFIRPYTSELDINSNTVFRVYERRTNEGVSAGKISTKIRADGCDNLIWKKLFTENRIFYSTNLVGETVRLFLSEYCSKTF